jgi:tetratricopeptide (TPR) repeat protein
LSSLDSPAANGSVDPQNPWLGLASFTEETRAYFYGRDDEVAELARRVQRKLLTVLFGQSGLGKTSILRAGIVPRLRPLGYCPVYVRLDYSPESPAPSEQIKDAIFRATQRSGAWTQSGAAVAGESLWEFLHHRDDLLRDGTGKALVPLLIFDQFEEIFTLAQGDDFGRQRAAQFIDELADLVENRPPKALEARMESDESAAEHFDFTRSDYRILIALREDYLAHLEVLKGNMPSITQNRMRLARMTGEQALSAVTKPGGALVSEEVAEAIVRFIAGGSELRNAEVEPSLLSLICRELNNARIAQGRAEISADLLAGSRDTILAEFYERSLADQPAAVRRFIEDELLTESGFRESLAEERVQRAFAAAGAPNALAALVNHRLLRIEERLDVRRVELTHDVLCSVVRASRDLRHEREARDAAERNLAEQHERERATRRALVRARKVAAACAVLAVICVASALFGYASTRRAQRAEQEAQQTRLQTERARAEAEKLTVFLLDDFQLELAPVGRLDIVADLAQRALAYYDGLPPELRTPETNRNRALALVRYGAALRVQSKLDAGDKVLGEAVDVLSGLVQQGDHSEITAIGLSAAITAQAQAARSRSDIQKAFEIAPRSVDVLQPLLAAPSPSVALRRASGDALLNLGVLQSSFDQTGGHAVDTLEAARQAFRGIDNLSLADASSAVAYAEASGWEASALLQKGRLDDAARVAGEAVDVATTVLRKHPGYTLALRARGLAYSSLAGTSFEQFMISKALGYGLMSAQDYEALVGIDPSNAIAWNNLGVAYGNAAQAYVDMGRLDDAVALGHKALDIEHKAVLSSSLAFGLMDFAGHVMVTEADLGNRQKTALARTDFVRLLDLAVRNLPPDSFPRLVFTEYASWYAMQALAAAGDFRAIVVEGNASAQRLQAGVAQDGERATVKRTRLLAAWGSMAEAQYQLHDYAAAAATSAKVLELRRQIPPSTVEEARDASDEQMLAALIAVRLGKLDEARPLAAQALALHRGYYARNTEDATQHMQMARALYVAASAEIGDRAKELAEATAILERLPPQMGRLISVGRLRAAIAEERGARR